MLEKDGAAMVATDGHRLSYARKKATLAVKEPQKVLVPRKAITELARLLEGEEAATYQQVDNHLVFAVGGRVLASKMIEGQFPAYDKVLAVSGDKIVKLQREALVAAIRRVSLLSSERSRAIRVGLSSGQLELSASSPDLGEARETVPTEYHGGPGGDRLQRAVHPGLPRGGGQRAHRAAAQGRGEPGSAEARRPRRSRASLRRDAHAVLGSPEVRCSCAGWSCSTLGTSRKRGWISRAASTCSWAGTPRARPRCSKAWGSSPAAGPSAARIHAPPFAAGPSTSWPAATRSSGSGRDATLELEMTQTGRRFRVDGRDVLPKEYHGRLEVVVYSTERLRVVRGSMRERRQFLDRGASALWPSYRQHLRDFERVLAQRNAALAARARDLAVWSDRFVELGAALRERRAAYAQRLNAALERGFRPQAEAYRVEVLSPASELRGRPAKRCARPSSTGVPPSSRRAAA